MTFHCLKVRGDVPATVFETISFEESRQRKEIILKESVQRLRILPKIIIIIIIMIFCCNEVKEI